MIDQCEKPVNLENFVFEEENHGKCLDVHVINPF